MKHFGEDIGREPTTMKRQQTFRRRGYYRKMETTTPLLFGEGLAHDDGTFAPDPHNGETFVGRFAAVGSQLLQLIRFVVVGVAIIEK